MKHNIAAPLAALATPIDSLTPDPANARTGHAIEQIAASLRVYGQRKPVVVNAKQGMKIEAGNGTWRAAKSLGWTHIAAVVVDDDPMTAAGYGIADNRLGDISHFDPAALKELVDSLDRDMGLPTGFADGELDALLAEMDGGDVPAGTSSSPVPDVQPKSEIAEQLRVEWGVEVGQIWRFPSRTPGREHRLICGDCTDAATLERLMGDERAAMVWTDPPYGVKVGEKKRNLASIRGQSGLGTLDMPGDDGGEGLAELLGAAFDNATAHCLAGGAWYVATPPGPQIMVFGKSLEERGIWRQTIQWIKNHATLSPPGADYHYRNEAILYGWLPGAAHRYYGGRNQDTVWEFDRPHTSAAHPSMKPVDLVARAIENSSRPAEIVLEPFSGSGTTIIACENTGRQCRAAEILPAYAAVALQRYKDAFGIEPEIINEE